MSDYEHIRCPQDIGFENIFPQEECEMRKFYGDCYHCWESSIAKRSQEIQADAKSKTIDEIIKTLSESEDTILSDKQFYALIELKEQNLP